MQRERRTLILGNQGYIGPKLVAHLNTHPHKRTVVGFDTGFFADCITTPNTTPDAVEKQWREDVRKLKAEHLEGVSEVVYLAAISNDPMGNNYQQATAEINALSAKRCAELAKAAGIKRFVFASSCSVYGAAGADARNEKSETNPLTAYAISKRDAEQMLAPLASEDFTITCLRFATACGASPRLRLDLVLNDFVASALSTGAITILSDGSLWRPLIDVEDMCRAMAWALDRKASNGGAHLVINTGYNEWNHTIRELADAVRAVLGDVSVSINPNAVPDKRSYKVDFSQFEALAPECRGAKPLEKTIRELADCIAQCPVPLTDFRNSRLTRLHVLSGLRASGKLDESLYWVS